MSVMTTQMGTMKAAYVTRTVAGAHNSRCRFVQTVSGHVACGNQRLFKTSGINSQTASVAFEAKSSPSIISSRKRFVCSASDEETTAVPDSPTVSPTTWELDFCSRPIIDERNKKVWELLVCDPDRTFEYAEYFPNNKINSVQLRKALERVVEEKGLEPPRKIRFFRSQMQTIITKACNEFGVKVVPSRRCFALIEWLQDRHENVYPQHPGFDPKAPPLMSFEPGVPEEIADALRGEQWAFVQLPLEAVEEEARGKLDEGFGEFLSIKSLKLDLPPETLIPGVAVFSRRALPLAAWTNGLELAGIKADTDSASLILETGVDKQWRYASYRRTKAANEEAEQWEAAKKETDGMHFLAIQEDPDAPSCAGFWMLRDYEPSTSI
ncbi:TGF-beta-activated kinase 1 and MAP3K7-binding protein 2 [Cymbomonas tetramitiformis]|uniref:TGF-beta-activated kinase 1 and MAP3K7-binding protein 2 n=1 Tax=Cymbomonas tetramitiformis TaxID=36881 RepID=A0AAE0CE68_9CHLO|nr:TGF-beta-activated kinase 1 and MAP3K7-binding protein 2 [Cymbomonas tetramitiformis]